MKKIIILTLFTIFLILIIASTANAIIGCCCDPVTMNGSFADDAYCKNLNFVFAGAPPPGKSCSDHCNATLTLPTTPATQCGSSNYRPAPSNVIVAPVKGEKEIKLSFGLICPPDSVKIERCEGTTCTDFKKIAEIAPSNSYNDNSVKWGEDYTYQLTAVYNAGDSSSIKKTIYSGDLECWFQYANYEFCTSPLFYNSFRTYLKEFGYQKVSDSLFLSAFSSGVNSAFSSKFNKGYACTQNNVLVNKVSCTSVEVCVSGTIATCTTPTSCDTGDIFGLYSSKSECEGTSNENYCFYDRSSTNVDACFECNAGMGCYNYNSKGSCETDNCGVGECEWRDVFPNIGTGVCIDKRFNNCEFCDKDSTSTMPNVDSANKIFDSCSAEKTEALSTTKYPCFYDIDSDKSVGCGEVACSDYSQSECSAHSSGITLNADNSLSTFSSDSCGIKVCDYDYSNKCFKDADGDAISDCKNSNNKKDCEKDWVPPETSVFATGIPGRHDYLNIKLFDKLFGNDIGSEKQGEEDYFTYLCIVSGSENCNIASKFPIKVRTNSLNLNDLQLQDDQKIIGTLAKGNNEIKYFSTDPSLNREVIKGLNVIACDKCAGPKILKISVTGGKQFEGDYYTATLLPTITIAFNEPSEITKFELVKITQNISMIKSPDSAAVYNYSFTPLAELAEDTYTFKINAKDKNSVFMDSEFTFSLIIDKSAGVMTITPADGTVLKTDSTDINISFNEPVTLSRVSLDEIIFLNKYALDKVSKDLTKRLTTSNNRLFLTNVAALSDGKKEINVIAKDFANNELTGRSIFFVATTSPKLRLKIPSWGVSSKNIFDIVVETSANAECRYVYDTPVAPPETQFTYLSKFETTGSSTHTISKFDKISAGDISQHLLHVFCKPKGEKTVKETFELSVDQTQPKIISAFAYPKTVVEHTTPSSNTFSTALKVQTDKPSFCRYSETQSVFDLMENNFLEFDKIPKQTHAINITVSQVKNYSYYVACKSLADVNSFTASISFKVDTSIPFNARSITPRYAPSTTFYLSVETNKKAFCYYGTTENSVNKCFADCIFTNGHVHEIKKTNPGLYKFFVQCNTGAGNEKSGIIPLNITVDNTPPYMRYVKDDSSLPDDPEHSWFSDRLRIAFLGNDSETRVSQYQYMIEKAFTKELTLDWTKSILLDGSPFYAKNLQLEDKMKYVVKVKPVNVVGLMGNYTSSNGVTVDFEKQPEDCINDLKDNNETDVDCGGACGQCDVGQLCTEDIDCELGYCVDNTCSEPLCDDNSTNGFETDVDCGGSCTSCSLNQVCLQDSDCTTNFCGAGICQEPDICANEILDNSETGIDCGGACPNKCSVDQSCLDDSDCAQELICDELTCKIPIDEDEDGIVDENDLCPNTPSRESADDTGCSLSQIDADGDGMSDSWEQQYGLDPNDPSDADLDLDKDGLTNLEEYKLGTDPSNRDSDFDGWKDGSEVSKGFDPLDADSHPSSIIWALLKWIFILALIAGIGYGSYFTYKKYGYKFKSLFKKKEPTVRIRHIEKPRTEIKELRKFAHKEEDKNKGWIPLREIARKIKEKEVEPEVFKKLKQLNKENLPEKQQKNIIKELEKEHIFEKLKNVAKSKKKQK